MRLKSEQCSDLGGWLRGLQKLAGQILALVLQGVDQCSNQIHTLYVPIPPEASLIFAGKSSVGLSHAPNVPYIQQDITQLDIN